MKKSILFILSCIPLFASCNNSSNGFINPFPDDEYHPYGFAIKEDESISRSLTTTEQTLVNYSINEKNDIYVKQHKVTTQTRDYTRAFAGEFQQGYASSNIKRTETSTTFRQEEATTPEPLRRRTVSKNHLDTIYDYSYGRNTSKVDTTEWHYFAEENNDPITSEKIYTETTDAAKQNYIISQIKSTESSTPVGQVLATKNGDPTWDRKPDEVFTDGLIHSEFLTPLAKCSPASTGADKKDNVILVKVEQNKYKDPIGKATEGIYELPDGRRYQAMENSLTVSRLELKKAVATGSEKTDWEEDWYLVSYARKYTEITITSKIIQPNVPIEMLTDPIVIHYTEEEHTFSTDNPTEISDEDIEPITIKDEK